MANALPLLSIIIPAHNEGAVLGPLLQDLKNQEITSCETIVVAHRCTDNTLAIATRAGAHGITLEHGNVCDARNFGAQYAEGSILIFIDADARIHDRAFLATLTTVFRQTPEPILTTGRVLPQDNFIGARLICGLKNICLRLSLVQTTNGYIAVPKKIWQAAGGFNPTRNPFELINFVRAAREIGTTFRFLPNTTTLFSMRRYNENGYLRTLGWWLGAALSRLFFKQYALPIPASEIVRKNPAPAPKKVVRP